MAEYSLSHLQELEAESIHIIREVAAEFENPVMLYSIGKDSSVMVRLAEKAFAPGKVPFPLMHIDSKWKFKEMIEFRDQYAKEHGWNLIVESNMEAFNAGVGPFTHGSKVHTDLMKTKALLDALNKYKFDAAFGGARRDEEKSRAKERNFSFRDQFNQWDPKNQRLGGGGGKTLGKAGTDKQITFADIFIGVGLVAQQCNRVMQFILTDEFLHLLLQRADSENIEM